MLTEQAATAHVGPRRGVVALLDFRDGTHLKALDCGHVHRVRDGSKLGLSAIACYYCAIGEPAHVCTILQRPVGNACVECGEATPAQPIRYYGNPYVWSYVPPRCPDCLATLGF